MGKQDELQIDQGSLVNGWQQTLQDILGSSDHCQVLPDEADAKSMVVTIETAGHQAYTFDFKITYVDSREVKVQLMDVERDNVSIDERGDVVQQLIQDYTRHLHECAQALQQLTHA